MDAAVFRPLADYEKALAKTLGRIKAVPPGPGFEEVLLPGNPKPAPAPGGSTMAYRFRKKPGRQSATVGAELGVNVEAMATGDARPSP